MIDLNDKKEKLEYILDLAWNILFERLISNKISINLESSMQLHYSSIINTLGELLIVQPDENFKICLEQYHIQTSQYIDIECSYNDIKAAIELKFFRINSNRAKETDMYSVLKDIMRLESFTTYQIKKFICLTDNIFYLDDKHIGHAENVSIKDGKKIKKGTIITPTWKGIWKNSSKVNDIVINTDIEFKWLRKNGWYYLIIDL
jgi:hypothetical protein